MTDSFPIYANPDQNDLFQAILADPTDDHLRSVYADWCEETGDVERAEFIRLQLEADLARRKAQAVSAYNLYHQRELWRKHKKGWNAPLHRHLAKFGLQQSSRRSPVRRWFYARGFVAAVEIEWSALSQHATALFRIGPIQALRIVNLERSLQRLSADEEGCLKHVSELTLLPIAPIRRYARGNPRICNAIRDLLRTPSAQSLARIELYNSDPELVLGYLAKEAAARSIQVRFRGLYNGQPSEHTPRTLFDWLKAHRLDAQQE